MIIEKGRRPRSASSPGLGEGHFFIFHSSFITFPSFVREALRHSTFISSIRRGELRFIFIPVPEFESFIKASGINSRADKKGRAFRGDVFYISTPSQ